MGFWQLELTKCGVLVIGVIGVRQGWSDGRACLTVGWVLRLSLVVRIYADNDAQER